MKCPFCGDMDSRVTDTRLLNDGSVTRRRRQCDSCQNRFITYEKLDTIPMSVIKRSGQREMYDREKILKGIIRAFNKRQVSLEQMERLVSDIESELDSLGRKEIETSEIGELVMRRLKALDEVGYVRFASVYKQFKDIDTFMAEITGLLKEKKP